MAVIPAICEMGNYYILEVAIDTKGGGCLFSVYWDTTAEVMRAKWAKQRTSDEYVRATLPEAHPVKPMNCGFHAPNVSELRQGKRELNARCNCACGSIVETAM